MNLCGLSYCIVDFIKGVQIKYIRIILNRFRVFMVRLLPLRHPGKGDKGWVFTDEVFVN